jgi:hypothetical protein
MKNGRQKLRANAAILRCIECGIVLAVTRGSARGLHPTGGYHYGDDGELHGRILKSGEIVGNTEILVTPAKPPPTLTAKQLWQWGTDQVRTGNVFPMQPGGAA